MDEKAFDQLWSERESRYPGWRELPADRSVHIYIDPEYAETYAGQVAAITAVSLVGRMSKSVAVDVPKHPVLAPLPWSGSKLDDVIMLTLKNAHPYGIYENRPARHEDIRLIVGPCGEGLVIHGSGWGAYCGTGPSPIAVSEEPNPFGAAFAVVVAASRLQLIRDVNSVDPVSIDTYLWQKGLPSRGTPIVKPDFGLGELWCIGVGSVGSCALFFLALATQSFEAILVDPDIVKVENVTRSAMFTWRDALATRDKAEVASRWLVTSGVDRAEPQVSWLNDVPERWRRRNLGKPDVLISAANERNVRHEIEAALPPLQVYATTGQNWQATMFRHIPLRGACSLCVPGDTTPQVPMPCATGSPDPSETNEDADDLALPFLSYAAGIMTAAEISKLALTGEVATRNRVFFEPRARELVRSVSLRQDQGCVCRFRDKDQYMDAMRASRFASLSVA